MVYKPLLRIFEERRAKLVETLKNFDRRSQLERQHQIFGAIQELDIVIRTLQAHGERMQRESEQLSAERLINETIASDRKKLDSAYKDLRAAQTSQYDLLPEYPFK